MKLDTRKQVVLILRKATDNCTDILHDAETPLGEALDIMTKAYLEMAVVNALAKTRLLGVLPSEADFKKVAAEVYRELKTKVLQ